MTVVVYKLSEIVTGKMTSCVQIVRNCDWELIVAVNILSTFWSEIVIGKMNVVVYKLSEIVI